MLDDADPAMVTRMEHDLSEMNQLITDMLAFARALQTDETTECDLNTVLSELAEQVAPLGPVEWQPQKPCKARVGESALRRIVSNLLENARRYGGDTPVSLVLECQPGRVRIGVLDRGPGIPAEEREAVFRPFYRLETSRSREGGGSGLGLAIVAQLADAYGWKINLEEREGGGLAVWVEILN
jgi:two-component system osmolarity sensor histidine kinase EnvZ